MTSNRTLSSVGPGRLRSSSNCYRDLTTPCISKSRQNLKGCVRTRSLGVEATVRATYRLQRRSPLQRLVEVDTRYLA